MVFDCGGGSVGWVGGNVVVEGVMDVGGVGSGGLAGYVVEGGGGVACVDGYGRLPVRFLDASNPMFYPTRYDAHAVFLFCGG